MSRPSPIAFARAASRLEEAVRASRGSETSRLVDFPGGAAVHRHRPDAQTKAILDSFGAYAGRVSPSAGPTRTRYPLWPGDDLTPEIIVGAQREAIVSGIPLRWVELIDQIYSRDGHYASCTMQRVADVVKGTWRLTPAVDDDAGLAVCNFIDEAYRGCSRWNDGLGWLLLSNLYTYNSVEVEWYETRITFAGPKGETIGPVDVVLPRRLHNVHPKHYRFDLDSDDPLFWIGNTYQPLPLGKFVFLDGEGLHPTKVRRGHAWQCIWYSFFRSISWSAWATHVDRFALPIPIIEYEGDEAQYNEAKAAYDDILKTLGQGKGVVMPKVGSNLRIEQPPSGGRENDPSGALSNACDSAQSIRVLGGQLSNKIGNIGSYGATSAHIDVKYGLEELDAIRMWERIDEQLSSPLVQFNAEALAYALQGRGYDVTPDLLRRRVARGKHHIPGKTDPMTEMGILDIAVNKLNLPISVSGTFARMDFQRARDARDQIKGEAQAVAKGGALATASEAAQPGGFKNPDEAADKTADAAAKTADTNAATAKSAGAKQEPKKPGSGEEN